MAFFKKQQQKTNNLWYPQSITVGKPVTTDQIADKLALLSTATRGDTFAIMKNLGVVMSDFMAEGRTVKIDGVGTFYYTAAARKTGVDSPDKVNANQITGVRVRFIPEVHRNVNKQVTTRSMVDTNIFWEEWGGKTSNGQSGGSTGGNTGGNTGGEDGNNPLG